MNYINQENFFLYAAEIFPVATILLFIVAITISAYVYNKHKQSYNGFLASKKLLNLLLETTSDLIYLIRYKPVFRLEYINPSITPLTGYLPEDFYASPQLFGSIIHPDDLPRLKESLEAGFSDTTEKPIHFRIKKSDKSFTYFEQKLFPVFDKKEPCSKAYVIAKKMDSTHSQLQDIYNIDRLSTIGQMASSVAHEIRNPMTTVRGYLQFFSGKKEFLNYKSQFELLISELDRSNLIIKEYLSLNQTKLSQKQLYQLNNIIKSLYPLLKAESNNISKDIEIELGDIPELYLNEKEIRQFILNMVKNALDSMLDVKNGTTVKIRTFQEGESVFISIKDQGTGIAPDILADLGKPFLTTKENGTGLGLIVCYQIADNHQASIKINTNNNGTEFITQFPIPENQKLPPPD